MIWQDMSISEKDNIKNQYESIRKQIKSLNAIKANNEKKQKYTLEQNEEYNNNILKLQKQYDNIEVYYRCDHCNNEIKLPLDKIKILIKNKAKPIFCSRKCSGIYYANKSYEGKTKKERFERNAKISKTLKEKEFKISEEEKILRIQKLNAFWKTLNKEQRSKRNKKAAIKAKLTKLEKYGNSNYNNSISIKNTLNSKTEDEWRDRAIKSSINRRRNSIASDGTILDSTYEKDVYEFCIRNKIPIETYIPLTFNYNNEKHTTLIDFKIDGLLFECKGGHLMHNMFDEESCVPQEFKREIYKQNHVIIITDRWGSELIPKKESKESNGLKYLNKCSTPLIGVDIDLFRNPGIPYDSDKPKCFYNVKVDKKMSVNEAWKDECIRWKMIKNRINYVGGFIDNKEILTAMNVTRTCKQPSWFSKTYAKELIQKYITTDRILDPFAGWGTRYDASIELGLEYIGCDMNKELVKWHHDLGRNTIYYDDANRFQTDNENCSVFICPPYTDYEIYFEDQDLKTTQCQWLSIVMKNIPNAKEYLMVCKVVDEGFEKYIVEEKVNKSHFGENKEYVILIKNKIK